MAAKNFIKVRVFSKKVAKKNGGFFRSYWCKMHLVVEGEEAAGKQVKSITVKFRQDAFDNVALKQSDINNGILTAVVDAPFIYKVTTNDAGDKVYPALWVREVKSFEAIESYHAQSDFFVDDEPAVADDYTILDELDTDEPDTEIKTPDDDLPF